MKKFFSMCLAVFSIVPSSGYAQVEQPDSSVIRLDSVEVKAYRSLVRNRAGKMIVDATLLRAGKANLLELLSSVPDVVVSDDNVSVVGRSGVRLMINGRLKNYETGDLGHILRSYPASDVKRVEVIKDPGARYEAAGNYAILNIILERKTGFIGGSVSEAVRYNKRLKNEAAADLRYNYRKTTVSLNAGWDYGGKKIDSRSVTRYPGETQDETESTDHSANNYSVIVGADYAVDSLSTVGLEFSIIDNHTKRRATDLAFITSKDRPDGITLNSVSDVSDPLQKANINFFADRRFPHDRTLTLTADLFRYKSKNHLLFNSLEGNTAADRLANLTDNKLVGASGKLDFSTPLPVGIEGTFGVQMSLSSIDNESVYDYSTLPVQNDNLTYKENIYAGYADLRKTLGNWEFVAGLRYEYTRTQTDNIQGERHHNSYGHLFPNAHVGFSPVPSTYLELATYSGVERPWLRAVNPFVLWVNRFRTSSGNPGLDPNYINNVTLDVSHRTGGLHLSLGFRYAFSQDNIEMIDLFDPATHVNHTRWENAYDERVFAICPTLRYRGLSWLYFSTMLDWSLTKSFAKPGLGFDDVKDKQLFVLTMANSISTRRSLQP